MIPTRSSNKELYNDIISSMKILTILIIIFSITIQTVQAISFNINGDFNIIKAGDPAYITIAPGQNGNVDILIQKQGQAVGMTIYAKILGHNWEYGDAYILDNIGVEYDQVPKEIDKDSISKNIKINYILPEYSQHIDDWFLDNITIGFSTDKNGPWKIQNFDVRLIVADAPIIKYWINGRYVVISVSDKEGIKQINVNKIFNVDTIHDRNKKEDGDVAIFKYNAPYREEETLFVTYEDYSREIQFLVEALDSAGAKAQKEITEPAQDSLDQSKNNTVRGTGLDIYRLIMLSVILVMITIRNMFRIK